MAKFIMTFGFAYNMIATISNGKLNPKKYNSLVDYRNSSAKFKSNIKITKQDVVCGDQASPSNDGALFIENLGEVFKNNHGEKYNCYDKQLTIDDIVSHYFLKIKHELDSNANTEPVESVTLIVPYEYSPSKKRQLQQILNSIHFKLDKFIDEPVANYLGYLKTYNIPYQQQDSFIMVNVEYDAIKVKIFDVQWDNYSKMHFQLDGNAFDMTFNLYDDLRTYFLNKIDPHLTYEKLTNLDKSEFDKVLSDLINAFKNDANNPKFEQFYIGLMDEGMDLDGGDITKEDFLKILENLDIYSKIQSIINNCLRQSHKSIREIHKIIYTGNASYLCGVQEKINLLFQLNQELMFNDEKLVCLGGFVDSQFTYDIEDHLKRIGIIVLKRGNVAIFKSLIPTYSDTKAISLKMKIPNGMQHFDIYEGYNGAGKNDCTLLKRVDVRDYADGNHSFTLERLANGGALSLIIYDNNFQFVTANQIV